MSEKLNVIISANPKSGARSQLALVHSLKERLDQRGFTCEIFTDLTLMSNRVKHLDEDGKISAVVAAGGDGTAAVVASLVPHRVPIALFPVGSENLLAKHFGATTNLDQVVAAIEENRRHALDVFLVNGKISLLMASVGFDAEVVRRVHSGRKSHITKWAYISAIASSLIGYRWPKLRIEILDAQGSVEQERRGSWLFAFNVPRYASGIEILPDAILNDGLLDIGIFKRGGLWRGIHYYWCVLFNQHRILEDWSMIRAPGLRVSFAEQGVARHCSYQTDGDWGGELPVEIVYSGRQVNIIA